MRSERYDQLPARRDREVEGEALRGVRAAHDLWPPTVDDDARLDIWRIQDWHVVLCGDDFRLSSVVGGHTHPYHARIRRSAIDAHARAEAYVSLAVIASAIVVALG